MESTINERLKQSIEYKKINPPDIYNKIGVRRQIWGAWINQNQAIPLDKLVKIVKLMPDINARWLLTGEGSMNEPEQGKTEEPVLSYKVTRIDCQECISKQKKIDELEEYRKKYIECLEELAGKKKAS